MFSKEPALWIGVIASVLTILVQITTSELTWAAAIPLIATAIVRLFVTPVPAGQRGL